MSIASTKITTKATSNDNGDDNDDNEAQRATFNAGHVDAKDLRRRHPQTRPNSVTVERSSSPSRPVPLDCGAVTGGIHTGRSATSPAPAGSSRAPVDLCAKEDARQFPDPGLLPRQEPENLSTGEEQQRGTTEETEETVEFMSTPVSTSSPTSITAQALASALTGASSFQTLCCSLRGV